MKCPHCSMEWMDRAGITDTMKNCPFCGGALAPRKNPENLTECLQQLYSQFGAEPFRHGQRLISLHSDLMPQNTRDRRLLTILVNCGGHTALLDALKKPAGEQSIAISRLEKKMEEEWMIKPDVIREVCSAFWLATCGSKGALKGSAPTKTTQKPVPTQQSAPPLKTAKDLIQTLQTISGESAAPKTPASSGEYKHSNGILTKYTGSGEVFVVPGHITAIGEYAFKDTPVKEVILPEGLTTISAHAFDSCNKVRKVHLPKSLRTIGDHAFTSCYKLEEICLPEGVTHIGALAFSFCHELRTIRFPGSAKATGFSCFLGCKNLQSVEFGAGFQTIDTLTFSGCKALRSLIVPDSLETIELLAFLDCKDITVTASEKWKKSHPFLLVQIP